MVTVGSIGVALGSTTDDKPNALLEPVAAEMYGVEGPGVDWKKVR